MDQKDAKVLRDNYVRLIKTLETQNVVSYLYQEGVLCDNDKEKISHPCSTPEEKAGRLLSILKKRKDGLKMMIKALLFSEVQAFLGNELLKMVTWSEKKMKQFKQEIEGKLDYHQMLETNNVVMTRENNQLKAKHDKDQEKIKELSQKLEMQETSYKEKYTLMKLQTMQLKAKYDKDVMDLTHWNRQLELGMECLRREDVKNQYTIKVLTAKNQMLKAENSKPKERDKSTDQHEGTVKLTCPAISETLDKTGDKVIKNNDILRSLKEEQAQKRMEGLKQASHQHVSVPDVIDKQEILEYQKEERKFLQDMKTREKKAHMRLEVHRLGFLA